MSEVTGSTGTGSTGAVTFSVDGAQFGSRRGAIQTGEGVTVWGSKSIALTGGGAGGAGGGVIEIYASDSCKTPLQEFAERAHANWDPTDGCPDCGGRLKEAPNLLVATGCGKWLCVEEGCPWWGPDTNYPQDRT